MHDFIALLVTPLKLKERREIAYEAGLTSQDLVTVRVDGTHVAISGRGLPGKIELYKSRKPNSKNETCVNIVVSDWLIE